MFLQIGSSFLLDQVSVFFYFFVFLILGKLLNLADEIVVAFTKSVCEPVEGNLICNVHWASCRCGHQACLERGGRALWALR